MGAIPRLDGLWFSMNTSSDSDTQALAAYAKEIKKQAEKEYRHLQLVFIVHKDGNRQRALELMRLEIEEHPEGKNTYEALLSEIDNTDGKSGFHGIIEGVATSLLVFKQTLWQAVFFINMDEFESAEDGRFALYHHVYHALALYQHYHEEDADYFEKDGNLIKPVGKLPFIMRSNMLGDIFAAVMCEFGGKKNAVRMLAKRRCEMSVSAIPGFRAELYPYPVTLDSTLLVLTDVLQVEGPPVKPMAKAIEIAEEVSISFDDNALKQWWGFARIAQEMAWMHFDYKRILGLATYTNEDAYMRSTAYLVAETMNTDPQAPASLSYYNPFTEAEVNQRLHKKLAEQALAQAIRRATETNYNSNAFDDVIKNMHISFFDGQPIAGWCVPALLAAQKAMSEEEEKPLKKDAAQRAFRAEFKKLPWEMLRDFWQKVTLRRRAGMPMSKAAIITTAKADEETKELAALLAEILPGDIKPKTEVKPPASPASKPADKKRKERAEEKAPDTSQLEIED